MGLKPRLKPFLKIGLFAILSSASFELRAAVDESALCLNAPELRMTYEFLGSQSDLSLPPARQLEIAKEVGSGCSGAFQRFSKTYILLKKSGVDFKNSLKTGIAFAKESSERSRNFLEFFQMSYLRENFDLDFAKSFDLAWRLSKDFVGNPVKARADFEKTVDFCQKSSGLSLPLKKCAELSVQIATMSSHFPNGSFKEFEELYVFLRQNSLLQLNMKEALETALNVMNFGPLAPANFRESFKFAMDPRYGLSLKSSQALKFSMEQAKLSNRGATLPIYE